MQNVLGLGTESDGTLDFYRHFYDEAFKMLKKLKEANIIKSGRDMEQVAWIMYRSPLDIPRDRLRLE